MGTSKKSWWDNLTKDLESLLENYEEERKNKSAFGLCCGHGFFIQKINF